MHLSEKGILYGIPEIDAEIFEDEIKCKLYVSVSKNGDPSKELIFLLKIMRYPPWNKMETSNAVIGLEQSFAVSANPKMKLFTNVYISSPFPSKIWGLNRPHPQLGSPLKVWGNIKFTSLPQQINSSSVQTPDEFKKIIKDTELNKIVRSFDFLAGFDLRLLHIYQNDHKTIYSLSLIGAAGASTPVNPIDSVQKYILSDGAKEDLIKKYDKYDEGKSDDEKINAEEVLKDKEYVAFLNPDWKSFYHQWYLGFRIKEYKRPKLNETKDKLLFRFPAYFEALIGHNDFIKPGYILDRYVKNYFWKALIIRIGGFLPIKVSNMLTVYIYGNVLIQLSHKGYEVRDVNPIIMKPALADAPSFPDDSKYGQLPTLLESRDFFQIGIGIELIKIVEELFKKE